MDYTNLTPSAAADERVRLAAEYARMSEELATILEIKPIAWEELRKEVKSDTAAERRWERTVEGIKEMQLRLKMRSNDKLQSALSSKIRVAENEAKHIW